MFLGRLYRKKRQVSLLQLHPPQKTRRFLNTMWRPPTQNAAWIQRNWYESVYRSHAAICGCGDCAGHFSRLAADLGRPSAPQAPLQQQLPVIRGLPALPAPPGELGDRAPWPGVSGEEGGDGGDPDLAAAGGGDGEPDDGDLLAAFDLAAE
jgi:hypothetical protein